MEQNESVYYMYTRFTNIVNTLGALGKTFSNSEKVKKIIRSLPKEWRPKRTVIEEAKDLNILPIDDLIGSLISYKEDLAAERGNEEKKKSIALKASKHESDEESELDEEEMDILARRFRKLFKKSSERRKFRDLKNRKEKNEVIKCYECKKPGYIRTECPLLNKLKKKAMVATWDDSNEETSDDKEHQEMTNLALMAIGDESDDELDEVNDLSTYDELYGAFKELHDNWIKIDIAQAVGAVSRYMANPGGEHWITVKRILRYIKGTSDVALCYGGSEFTIRGYVDSDFTGDLDKRKSTTGYVFTLAGTIISWVSNLQTVVALSTTEAEYMVATQACKEAIWIQRLLEELGHKQQKIPVFCDNQSALHIARNPAFHFRTKHIGVQYHFVREVGGRRTCGFIENPYEGEPSRCFDQANQY
ncbi:hypothetical protein KPL71_012287 [Citrus sinensis]|uniref:Uncharacterized protein n=1 Tax=Citrus sinensis TaxID=2711 RepID=A0ACB8L9J4_CITSI|nr:hypothetical protein KPL71_012287 [Citrus sinensis]